MDREEYFDRITKEFERAKQVAIEAKKRGAQPEEDIEINFAVDMAERCEFQMSTLGFDIPGLAERIRELEEKSDIGREEEALELAKEFANGELGNFESKQERVEAAVRTSVSLLTEGVVAAPIEGIREVTLESGDNGQEFVRVHYAGPIRSAGGTGQALSVLVADFVRQELDIGEYHARDEEVERTISGVKLYDDTNGLQYMPSEEDLRTIIENLSVMLDGDGVTERKVDGYRNLERISTDQARGGLCLTLGEGIAQKAAKLQRYTGPVGIEGWEWLSELELGVKESNDDEEENENQEEEKEEDIKAKKPKDKYLEDTITGRPVFSHPSRPGGFRLRYGRARNTGLAASGVSPASMELLNRFIAPGTQLKTEYPGKAQGVAPVDYIEGPTVRLKDGTVLSIDTREKAMEVEGDVDEILDIGEILIPFGEFVENNARLKPSSYVHEWWEKELAEAGYEDPPKESDLSFTDAVEIAEEFNVPLHPKYTYLWHDIEPDEFSALSQALEEGERPLSFPPSVKRFLERLLVPHREDEGVIKVEEPHASAVELCLSTEASGDGGSSTMQLVNDAAGITIRERAPSRIGARMGRPEKSRKREVGNSGFHTLFPVGREVGNRKLVADAAREAMHRDTQVEGDESSEVPTGHSMERVNIRYCSNCEDTTFSPRCRDCGERTEQRYYCSDCDLILEESGECPQCGDSLSMWKRRPFPISELYQDAIDTLGVRGDKVEGTKGVEGLDDERKIPEELEKGLLRGKHDITPFADGTSRYDLNDLPLTAFRPEEINTDLETLRELGYEEDMEGKPLEDSSQVVPLHVQDVVMHKDAVEYFLKVADFIDQLFQKHYGLEPYYEADSKEDLIGSLFMGLAPHTSSGVLCRLIGYTEASAGYAHPFFHAAKRRNCFHPNTEMEVEIDGEWKRITIEELVETYLDEGTSGYDDSYDDGSEVHHISEHPGVDSLRVPSMNERGDRTRERVTHVSKHSAPNHMVMIELENGRELVVTPDHQLPVADHGAKMGHEIEAGDQLWSYDEESLQRAKSFEDIDLVELLLKSDVDISDIIVCGIDMGDLTNHLLTSSNGRVDSAAQGLGIDEKNQGVLSGELHVGGVPLEVLVENLGEEVIDVVPDDVTLKRRGDEVPRVICRDEELGSLLEYYATESSDGKAVFETGEDRQFVQDSLERKFGVEWEGDEIISVPNELVGLVFEECHVPDSNHTRKKVEVSEVSYVEPELQNTYNLTTTSGSLEANYLHVYQCDGDEDSFMLLIDGLVNHSEKYLAHNKTGWSMDIPLVGSRIIDSEEIDDEAHNVDIVEDYPLSMYEESLEYCKPGDVNITIAEDVLGEGAVMRHTIETSDIAAGPKKSSYIEGDITEKIKRQLGLAEKTRAADESDVAEMIIDNHFMPDIKGNLRAYSQQDFRCTNCETMYRRLPLDGTCDNCGQALNLTVYEGSVNKYIEDALRVIRDYNVSGYIQETVEVKKGALEHLFEDETERQTGIEEFM